VSQRKPEAEQASAATCLRCKQISAATCLGRKCPPRLSAPINDLALIGSWPPCGRPGRRYQFHNTDTYQTRNRSSIASRAWPDPCLRTNGASILCFVGISVSTLIGSASLSWRGRRSNQLRDGGVRERPPNQRMESAKAARTNELSM
jgi:hypothetical protein